MSLKDRVVDGVSSLFDKLGGSAELSAVDAHALEKELGLRVDARKSAGDPKPEDNQRARMAQAGTTARQQREAMAQERVARIHALRNQKAKAKQAEQDAAYRNMAEEARRNPPPRQAPPRDPGPGQAHRGPSRPSIFQNKDMAQHYKTLGVDYGADAATVKKAYRQLMRKYHPDLHQDPKKKKAATELTMKISVAYESIEKSRKS